jgi:hypothetical protein
MDFAHAQERRASWTQPIAPMRASTRGRSAAGLQLPCVEDVGEVYDVPQVIEDGASLQDGRLWTEYVQGPYRERKSM